MSQQTKQRRSLREMFDIRDAFFFGGLALAAVGGSLISPRWTLVIVGAVFALKGHGPLFPPRGGE